MAHPHGGREIAGRYRLQHELGRGGMGAVWEAHDMLLNRSVAVKEVLLPPNLSPAEHERQLVRTAREARTAAKLNHPGIVAVYDVVEEDGRPWIVMELVRAQGLDEAGLLPVRQVAGIGRQVLAALHTAHQAGILHRDVKPSNILLTSDGRAVLTDFGIATVEGDASLTQTGMVTGSPSFLAPERATGTPAGPWSDLWALGATMYAMLVGQAPFERRDAIATLGALLTEEPDFGRVPPEMHEVLYGLLQREPAHRLTAEQADRLLAEAAGDPADARRTAWSPAAREHTSPIGHAHRDGGHRDPEPGPPERSGPSRAVRDGRTGVPPSRRRRRSPLALVVVAALLLAGAGTAGLIMLRENTSVAAEASAEPERTESKRAERGRGEGGVKKRRSPSPEPEPESEPTPTADAVPRLTTTERGDWSIERPSGWTTEPVGSEGVRWTRPGGGAAMSVEGLGSFFDLESVRDSTKEELEQRIEIVEERTSPVTGSYGESLDWEFTWRLRDGAEGEGWGSPGVTYREKRRFIEVGATAMVLTWTTPAEEWPALEATAEAVLESFEVRRHVT
ncbi:serine/threonine protein kinase [Planomonospora sp. ID67723]|uniref:serine/threonine-protein kinase n=1 Tax=Planomonospora sp. ID67723 TaxID=2738134 RepID=UPI0018C38EFF|nr:serine/threonine-protein kinase [Planomonospora sp. ID67723]MBG0830492.1 serine/threonine protein kinase [Planomonospora sp. ID67723]